MPGIAAKARIVLGLCGTFVDGGRCDGAVVVTERGDVLTVGECERCGTPAAVPTRRLREVGEQADGPWWDR